MIGVEDDLTWYRLSKGERTAVRRAAQEILAGHRWALAAWHHGSSAAAGEPARDVDIAVVAEPIPTDLAVTDRVAEELAAASSIESIPFDVRIVNGASPVFLGEMLRRGTLIYERERATRIEWEAAAMSLWLDFKPIWERARRAALASWTRG